MIDIPSDRPPELTPEMETEILNEITVTTTVENGDTIEVLEIPSSLFNNHDYISSCSLRYAIGSNDSSDHRLDFLVGFSPMSPVYPMKIVRNVDQDTFEIIKLPENVVWVKEKWSRLQNTNPD